MVPALSVHCRSFANPSPPSPAYIKQLLTKLNVLFTFTDMQLCLTESYMTSIVLMLSPTWKTRLQGKQKLRLYRIISRDPRLQLVDHRRIALHNSRRACSCCFSSDSLRSSHIYGAWLEFSLLKLPATMRDTVS